MESGEDENEIWAARMRMDGSPGSMRRGRKAVTNLNTILLFLSFLCFGISSCSLTSHFPSVVYIRVLLRGTHTRDLHARRGGISSAVTKERGSQSIPSLHVP